MITIEKTFAGEIPLLLFTPQSEAPLPVVVFYHGFHGRKEDGVETAYALADAGLACALPDAPNHGERLGGDCCAWMTPVTRWFRQFLF